MECTCENPEHVARFQEHEIGCPLFEPPLIGEEIRALRQLLGEWPKTQGRILQYLPTPLGD